MLVSACVPPILGNDMTQKRYAILLTQQKNEELVDTIADKCILRRRMHNISHVQQTDLDSWGGIREDCTET